MKTTFLVVACLMCLSACQTTNPLEVAAFNKHPNKKLPSMSISLKPPSQNLETICKNMPCQASQVVTSGIVKQLVLSQAFEEITSKENRPEYEMEMSIRLANPEKDANLAKGLAAAATLGLMPLSFNMHCYGEFRITRNDGKIMEYNTDFPYESKSIQDPNQKILDFIAESLASKLIAKLQTENFDIKN